MTKKSMWSVLVFGLMMAVASPLFAQNGPPGGGGAGGPGNDPNGGPGGGGPGGQGGGPGGPGGGPPNFAQMRQHEMQDIQDDLDVSAELWKNLQPNIDKLIQLHDELSPHHRPPPRNQDDDAAQDPVSKALDDLRQVLGDQNAKPEAIRAKVDAYEKAKAQAADELKKGEDDLKTKLTPLQQAILIAHGVLD